MATSTKPKETPLPPDDERAPDDAIAEPVGVASDETGATAREDRADAEAPAPSVPTREDIRQRIKAMLAAGEVTIEDIICDMYASQYAVELHLQSFRTQFESFSRSGFGRMLTRRAEKEARKHADQE